MSRASPVAPVLVAAREVPHFRIFERHTSAWKWHFRFPQLLIDSVGLNFHFIVTRLAIPRLIITMSITDTMQSSGTAPLKVATAKTTQPRRMQHRVRRGQKLDEVVSLSEQRLNQPTSSTGDNKASTSSSSTFTPSTASSEPGPSSSAGTGGDSPFQLQEYLAMLVRRDPHAVETITSLPTEADIESLTSFSDKGKSKDDSSADDDGIFQNVDTDIWVYEQLRRLVLDLTTPWLTSLQQECDKHSRPQTCAAMNAGDWMYLCASHGEEKQCCAIDYMVHTLDGATSLLNSARHFPSRTYVPNTSLRHFGSIARRLSRIFVHAWCYHKDVFMACEAETSLYSRFYVLVETYDLTATDNLPPRPGHGSTSSMESASGYDVDENEFSRGGGNGTPAFTLNGTTAKRERSGTAASRSLLTQSMQQMQIQSPQEHKAASSEVDAVGLVPPPAPSPRPTAILSRPDHEEGDDDAPAWTQNGDEHKTAGSSFLTTGHDDEDDDDEDDDEEEDGGTDADDRTQKIGHRDEAEEEDATINMRGSKVDKVGETAEEKADAATESHTSTSGETATTTSS